MDILAHGLWAAAAAKAYNFKCTDRSRPFTSGARREATMNPWIAAFWGVFPDLFAFTIPFAWLIIGPLFGDEVPRMGPPQEGEPPPNVDHWAFRLASLLYNYSHSIVIFLVILALVWAVKKKVYLVTFGWLLHILIDIPTHSYEFYPTPFLWPLSQYKLNGISWATPWFFIATYAGLAVSYLILWYISSRQKKISATLKKL